MFHMGVIREDFFTKIYRVLYDNAMLVPLRGTGSRYGGRKST